MLDTIARARRQVLWKEVDELFPRVRLAGGNGFHLLFVGTEIFSNRSFLGIVPGSRRSLGMPYG